MSLEPNIAQLNSIGNGSLIDAPNWRKSKMDLIRKSVS